MFKTGTVVNGQDRRRQGEARTPPPPPEAAWTGQLVRPVRAVVLPVTQLTTRHALPQLQARELVPSTLFRTGLT